MSLRGIATEAFEFGAAAFVNGDLRFLDELFLAYIGLQQLQIEGHYSRVSDLCYVSGL